MSLVSGYPAQAYHPGPLGASHDFYPGAHHYPAAGATPAGGQHYRVAGDPSPGSHDYIHNWMLQTSVSPGSDMGGAGAGMQAESPCYGFPPPGSMAPGGDYNMAMLGMLDPGMIPHGAAGGIRVRGVKRRNTNNKKERRRTHSINSAFASLRGCIPNVPSDTKLSKIKTLRLATSYIAYLMDVLNKDDPKLAEGGFKAEVAKKIETREEKRRREAEEMLKATRGSEKSHADKKNKGRTGWPQQVWAAELKS